VATGCGILRRIGPLTAAIVSAKDNRAGFSESLSQTLDSDIDKIGIKHKVKKSTSRLKS